MPESGYYANLFDRVILFNIVFHRIEYSHLIGAAFGVYNLCGFNHIAQIPYSAFVFATLALCGVILGIFAQIPEAAGEFDLFQNFGPHYRYAVFKLLLHFVNIDLGQFVIHSNTSILKRPLPFFRRGVFMFIRLLPLPFRSFRF